MGTFGDIPGQGAVNMITTARQSESIGETDIARNLLELGATLYECRDMNWALEAILRQARALARAEAGSLYLAQRGELEFVAVQNDRLGSEEIAEHLHGRRLPIDTHSLAGFVASTGEHVNVPDSRRLPPGAPFRVNRDIDPTTGYEVRSILAIPLRCPDGGCIGVMELFNRLGPGGEVGAFPEDISDGEMLLAGQAAMTLHNLLLQEQLRQAHLHSILRLAGIAEYRDADTGEHIQRVSRVSELLAEKMSLPPAEVELIKYASPMHDVGKVAIPDAILLKPGHLTAHQRQVMERHTVLGAEMLGDDGDDILDAARHVALRHHERWDGQGYPHGKRADAIPLAGRIVGLADVFDAVVSKRCYKDACSLDVALDILDRDRGAHFDPDLVDLFLDNLDEVLESYPALQAA